MEDINVSVSESGSYKLDLTNELNAVQNQTIATALTGLIFISLALAAYFFFTQKTVSHSSVVHAEGNISEQTTASQLPNVLKEGSRTLESNAVNLSELSTVSARTENIQATLKREVITVDSDNQEMDDQAIEIDGGSDFVPHELPKAVVQDLPALTENDKRRQRNQIKLFCAKLGEKLGSVSVEDCLKYEFTHSGTVSNEKTPIAYLDYQSNLEDSNNSKPIRVLLFGGIHGDEFSAVSIVFKWLKFLESEYSEEEQKNIHWRVVPVLNPDGLLQPNGQSKRMNGNNVDLNRNFPTPDWEQDALRLWKERTGENKRRYPGSAPASELETQWVLSQLESFKPDAVISVHAPFGIVDADGPVEPPQKLGPLELKLLGTYPGSMGRYIGVHKNLPMLTVELERAGSMPKQDDIEHIWLDIQDWIANKVQDRDAENQAEMQSLRREDSDTNGSTVIDKKGGD